MKPGGWSSFTSIEGDLILGDFALILLSFLKICGLRCSSVNASSLLKRELKRASLDGGLSWVFRDLARGRRGVGDRAGTQVDFFWRLGDGVDDDNDGGDDGSSSLAAFSSASSSLA